MLEYHFFLWHDQQNGRVAVAWVRSKNFGNRHCNAFRFEPVVVTSQDGKDLCVLTRPDERIEAQSPDLAQLDSQVQRPVHTCTQHRIGSRRPMRSQQDARNTLLFGRDFHTGLAAAQTFFYISRSQVTWQLEWKPQILNEKELTFSDGLAP